MMAQPDLDETGSDVSASLPSYIPSVASCMQGDLDADDVETELLVRPDWSDGVPPGHPWVDREVPPRGGGDQSQATVAPRGGGDQSQETRDRTAPPRGGGDQSQETLRWR